MWSNSFRYPHLILLAVLLGLPAAAPCVCACGGEEVKITVVAILATDQNTKICPTLESLAAEVRKKRPHLTGFCQAVQTCKSVAVGKEDTFGLVERQIANVTVCHGANEKNRVCLRVKSPGVGEITYTAACGKFFPIVTGYQTKNKDTLIIAIRVETCNSKE